MSGSDSNRISIENIMKNEEKIVYRIKDRKTGEQGEVYDRSCRMTYEFESVHEARKASVYGTFENKEKYRIEKYRITYELIDPDCAEEE